MSTSAGTAELLTASVREGVSRPLDRLDVAAADELARAARFHRVSGYVLRHCSGVLPPGQAADSLQRDTELALATHLRALADHRAVAAMLDQAGIEHLVLKGPVLSDHLHGGPDRRSYRDLDLLVRGEDLEPAVRHLSDQGLTVSDRNWSLLAQVRAGQLHLSGPWGTPIDLHWHVLFRESVRHGFGVRMDEMFERRREVRCGQSVLPTLDPVDMLLHLCLHAAQAGGHRLVWLKDVERCVAVDRPDWDEVVTRAHRQRLGLTTAIVLRRTMTGVGAVVPAEVLERLCPSAGLRRVMALADRITPPARASLRGSPARFLAKSARADGVATLAEMARRLAQVDLAALRYWRRPHLRPDPTAGLLVPSGGSGERSRYFADVGRPG